MNRLICYCMLALIVGYTIAEDSIDNHNLNQGHYIPEGIHVEGYPRRIKEGHVVPEQFTWANVDGVNYLTNNRNQHIPQYCGSCWAHAATYVVSDRAKIHRKAAWPDINIAPQVLVSCDKQHRGCSGGWPLLAYKYMKEQGITDETCSPYQARGYKNGLDCSEEIHCMDCSPSKGCFPVEEYNKYFVDDYGFISGEKDMVEEVSAWGPISCSVALTKELHEYTGGIFVDHTGRKNFDHEVEIVGYGVENGTKYWHIRNSWGSNWGEHGFFKLIRGIDNLAIETNCSWANLKDTWSEGKEYIYKMPDNVRQRIAREKLYNSIKEQLTVETQNEPEDDPCRVPQSSFEGGEKITKRRPHEYIDMEKLPKSYDWRNVSGVSYASWSTNQHVPHNCGSCWAHATTASLADRIMIHHNRTDLILALSVQALINCRGGGDCKNGNPGEVYKFAHDYGIPDSTCMNYEGKQSDKVCDPFDICRDCEGPPPPADWSGFDKCWTIPKHENYFVSEYGHVKGVDKMKAEIYERGPISCGLKATKNFEKYTGGVYSEYTFFSTPNHEVSLVGWGVTDDGQEYWIGRNSWGTYWGEKGFFRIDMHKDNLGINKDCTWGVPVVDPAEKEQFRLEVEKRRNTL